MSAEPRQTRSCCEHAEEAATLRQELASSRRAVDELRREVAELRQRLAQATPDEAPPASSEEPPPASSPSPAGAVATSPPAAGGHVLPFANHHSSGAAKVALFRALFVGRDDVYARRWESPAKGESGWQPAHRQLAALLLAAALHPRQLLLLRGGRGEPALQLPKRRQRRRGRGAVDRLPRHVYQY